MSSALDFMNCFQKRAHHFFFSPNYRGERASLASKTARNYSQPGAHLIHKSYAHLGQRTTAAGRLLTMRLVETPGPTAR